MCWPRRCWPWCCRRVFANNALTNLALSFGAVAPPVLLGAAGGQCAGRRLLHGDDLADLTAWAEGGMAEPLPAGVWSWDMVALLFAVCLVCPAVEYPFADDGKRLAAHGGAGRGPGCWALLLSWWCRRFCSLDDLSQCSAVAGQPAAAALVAVGIGFLAGCAGAGRSCPPALYKIGGETMKKSMTGQAALPFPRFFCPLAVYAALRYAGAAASPVCLLATGPGGLAGGFRGGGRAGPGRLGARHPHRSWRWWAAFSPS